MIWAVFDTVGFVRGLINPLSRWGHVLFDYADDYQLIVSEPIVLEVLDVLRRPAVVRLFKTLPGRDVAAIVAILTDAEFVEVREIPAVSRDPKDDKFLATAVLAGADYLVSEDQDLLVLQEYSGVRIVNAATFLSLLGA
ncbi:MAG: putative toxin-antitoxin system toxin component, PIN family [Thermomicrobiales bacterium]